MLSPKVANAVAWETREANKYASPGDINFEYRSKNTRSNWNQFLLAVTPMDSVFLVIISSNCPDSYPF